MSVQHKDETSHLDDSSSICTACGKTKDLSCFAEDQRYRSGRRSQCVTCFVRRAVKTPQTPPKSPQRIRNRSRQIGSAKRWDTKRPGWTEPLFDRAWRDQAGCCAICAVEMSPTGVSRVSVCADHDHSTGLKRDLICRRCNASLGLFDEIPDRLFSAATYLRRYSQPLLSAPQ